MPRHPPCALSSLSNKELISLLRCSRPLCSSQTTGGNHRHLHADHSHPPNKQEGEAVVRGAVAQPTKGINTRSLRTQQCARPDPSPLEGSTPHQAPPKRHPKRGCTDPDDPSTSHSRRSTREQGRPRNIRPRRRPLGRHDHRPAPTSSLERR